MTRAYLAARKGVTPDSRRWPIYQSGQTAPLWLVLLIGIVFALLWSSAFSVAKILVANSPPFAVSALRFAIASALAGSIAFAIGQRIPSDAKSWRAIVILGLCQNTIYLGLFFSAMTRISAGIAVIIASSMPLIVAAAAPVMANERISGGRASGLLLGFGGVVWIMSARITGGIDLAGVVLALCGVLALATATLTVKRTDFGAGLLMVVACQMFVGCLGCIPVALLFEDVTKFNISTEFIAAFAYQVAMPGIVATLLWFALVKLITATGASSFHFLNPIFGVAIAHFMLGDPVTPWDGLGIILVAVGILIVNLSPSSDSMAGLLSVVRAGFRMRRRK